MLGDVYKRQVEVKDEVANVTGEAGGHGRFSGIDVNPEAKLKAVLEISNNLAGTVDLQVMLPKILDTQHSGTYAEVLRKGRLVRGAIGIFLYVGAEVAIGSYLVNYFLSMDLAEVVRNNDTLASISATLLGRDLATVDAKGVVGAFVALYWGGAMVGRFVGSYLTKAFKPATVLALFGMFAIMFVLFSINTSGILAMGTILGVGLFNSIMFPTIFTLSIEGLGSLKPQASGILCTAIVGGAVIPPLLGLLADGYGFKVAFILVVACYAYIAYFAWREQRDFE